MPRSLLSADEVKAVGNYEKVMSLLSMEIPNDIFQDRFSTLVNSMKKHKIHKSSEETNIKFLRRLPKEWKTLAMSLKANQDLEYKVSKKLLRRLIHLHHLLLLKRK
ncbi:hypothetical protein L1987_06320 [Smallanthus sonchifolius]|uniref:Uncharacterized protein n=1 Tax=Smallanthus sonchifolius TaxID=185202 RepID=A0ACB9JXT5_9ASTR|nr:hypothetical protein L1987_06320 [Smallanthus sonchifolius]